MIGSQAAFLLDVYADLGLFLAGMIAVYPMIAAKRSAAVSH